MFTGFETEIAGAIVVKINIGTVPTDEINSYMDTVIKHLKDERLERQGFMYSFIPVRDEETSITFIDLKTMNSARA